MKVFNYSQKFFEKDNSMYNESFKEIDSEFKKGNDVKLVTLTIGTFIDNFKHEIGYKPKFEKIEETKTEYKLISEVKVNEVIEQIEIKENNNPNAKPNKKASPKRSKRSK